MHREGELRPPLGCARGHLRRNPLLVVEDATTGFCGAVLRWENGIVQLEDRRGKVRSFPLGPGFLVDGRPVSLEAPVRAAASPA